MTGEWVRTLTGRYGVIFGRDSVPTVTFVELYGDVVHTFEQSCPMSQLSFVPKGWVPQPLYEAMVNP